MLSLETWKADPHSVDLNIVWICEKRGSKMKRRLIAAIAVTLGGLSSIAQAQEARLPGFMSAIDDLIYVGEAGGIRIYANPAQDLTWFVPENGDVAIAGAMFSGAGRDIGAAFTGQNPIRVFERQIQMSETPPKIETSVNLDGPANVKNEEIEDQPTMIASQAATAAAANASRTLDGLPDQVKRSLLEEFTLALSTTSTPEEYMLAVQAFQARIDEAKGQQKVPMSDADVVHVAQAALAKVSDQVDALEGHNPEPPNLVDQDYDIEDPSMSDVSEKREAVYSDMQNGFWFAVGAQDAPTVYALMDPACPFCAKAVHSLMPDLQAGKLQLRILLAPLVSEGSPDLIAGVLTADKPVDMFMKHEISKAEGVQSPLVPAPYDEITPNLKANVQNNIDFAFRYDLGGVPFFAWKDEGGIKAFSGVPKTGAFSDALVDDYNGNSTSKTEGK
jgi:hypothetical protein